MPKIFLFRLNIRSFGDLATDAIFVRQLPQILFILPVYPPLIKIGYKKNYSNKLLIKRIYSDIKSKSSAPNILVEMINIIFQVNYLVVLVIYKAFSQLGYNSQFLNNFLQFLFGRAKLFSLLQEIRKPNLFSETIREVPRDWWKDLDVSIDFSNDLERRAGKLAVIHHRPQSNAGLIFTEPNIMCKAIDKLILEGFVVVRIKETTCKSLQNMHENNYHEININNDANSSHIKLIENSSIFIGSSSGPIWVSLYFSRPTLQLNYTDFLLNGPFLTFHFAAPMKFKVKASGSSYHFEELLGRSIDGHIFGKNVLDDLEMIPLNSKEISSVVSIFLNRIGYNHGAKIDIPQRDIILAQSRRKIALDQINVRDLRSRHGSETDWNIELKRIQLTALSQINAFITLEKK